MGPTATAARCPICAQPHAACGPVGAAVAVDPLTADTREPYTMADLKEYQYVVNGLVTTAMLTEADAKALGATPVTTDTAGASDTVTTKARPEVSTAARSVPNKAR